MSICGFKRSISTFIIKTKKLVDELSELGTQEIRFTGGEPTWYEDLCEAISYIRSKNMRASIITNGAYLINLADDLLNAGLSGITCSLDSPCPQVHNFMRGTPHLLEDALAGLALINKKRREKGVPVRLTVNTIVSNKTYDHLDEFVPLLESIGVDT